MLVCSALSQYTSDSFGLQEATPEWIELVEDKFSDKYDSVVQMMKDSKFIAKRSDFGATALSYGLAFFKFKPIGFIFCL